MRITEITPVDKTRVRVSFDDAKELVLYKSECRKLGLEEQADISDAQYGHIYYEIVGKRAKKRALHLLEKMDRTEEQLRRKLLEGQYPRELADEAVAYVKSYRYIDDERYARTFIRLNQERRSAARMKMDLLAKGVAADIIEAALEEELETAPETLIQRLLEKKHFEPQAADARETARMYQYLLRRGFRSQEIMHVLKADFT